jgi:hypothetical protein
MNQKHIPEVGKQYNQWTIISDEIKRGSNRATYWKVICKCGKETSRNAISLITGHSKSCKSCARTDTYNTFTLSYFRKIEKRAKDIKVEFDLTVDFLWKLYEAQDKKCALSGIPIEFKNSWRTKGKCNQTCSLDRIDNTKGYTTDNVQWLHKDVNFMKHTFTQDYFISICKQITQNKS